MPDDLQQHPDVDIGVAVQAVGLGLAHGGVAGDPVLIQDNVRPGDGQAVEADGGVLRGRGGEGEG